MGYPLRRSQRCYTQGARGTLYKEIAPTNNLTILRPSGSDVTSPHYGKVDFPGLQA